MNTPEMLDGLRWEDHVRVAREGRHYVVKKSSTGRVLARFGTIDAALEEAQRRSAGRRR